jgi:hypothetical protein
MITVLDTSALQHLLRTARKARRKGRPASAGQSSGTALDTVMRGRRLRLCLDAERALISEWEQTCGREHVRVVVTTWQGWGGLTSIERLPKLGRHVAKTLRQLQFLDTVDKIVLRLSLSTDSKCVVTEDSDFWDPTEKASKGDPSAAVAAFCRDELDVRMWLLGDLLTHLGIAR